MTGRQPGPAAQLLRTGEAGHIADLGDEHRRGWLGSPVAAVASQVGGDDAREAVDVAVVDLDEIQQRRHSQLVGWRQPEGLEQVHAGLPNRSVIGTATPSLTSTACTWAFNPERSATSLARKPHELAQFADLRRGDPCLGQPVHAIDRPVGGVADIVFHPSVGHALDPQRVRLVDTGTFIASG